MKVDTSNFYNEDKKVEYRTEVLKGINKINQQQTIQEKWNTICTVCKDAGKKIFGTITNHKKKKDETLQRLSSKSHKIRHEISATQDSDTRKKKAEQRKAIKVKIWERLKQIEETKLEKKLQEIENSKNYSTRYYKAIKEINRSKKVETLTVKNEKGEIAATEEHQIEIVTAYFEKMLVPKKRTRKELQTKQDNNTLHRRRDSKSCKKDEKWEKRGTGQIGDRIHKICTLYTKKSQAFSTH